MLTIVSEIKKVERVVVDERETEVRRHVRNECNKLNVSRQTMLSAEKEALEHMRDGFSAFAAIQRARTFLRSAGHSNVSVTPPDVA